MPVPADPHYNSPVIANDPDCRSEKARVNSSPRVRHYFTHFESLGGVQSIIQTHLDFDANSGLDSSLLAFFDPPGASPSPLVSALGLKGHHTIRQARNRFRQHERDQQIDVSIFHDLWGLAFLGEFDSPQQRRIGAVHSQWPHLEYQLTQLRGSLDGVFCDSQILADLVLQQLPELSPERVRHLPVPTRIASEEHLLPKKPLSHRRLILGFVGRLDFAQKRVERFPALLQALQTQGIDCELHFLGTGTASDSLPQMFPADAPVTFHGRHTGDAYWKVLREWDFVIYTSDHEGSPLALIEAMSAGNLPIFPRIGCGADQLIREVNKNFLYESTQWNAVAQAIRHTQQLTPESVQSLRDQCRAISLRHSRESYHAQFTDLFRYLLNAPRLSRAFSRPRPHFLTDWLPFGALRRYFPQGFFRANPVAAEPR